MNYLAHLYLARQSPDAMLGALLGDFVRGDVRGLYGRQIELEILLHRRIDSYTDRHPVMAEVKQVFAPDQRRFVGIALDVFYDHALARRWGDFHELPLDRFNAGFYAALIAAREQLPPDLAQLAPRMVEQDWLGSYYDFAGVEMAINRISRRLSRNGHLLRDTVETLRRDYELLCASFDRFFPDLIVYAGIERERLSGGL